MSVLDLALGLAGLPEKTITDLDANLPALERLAADLKMAEPLIAQLIPILTKAMPDIIAVTPLIQELVTFAKQKEAQS
jgi:hypothetical protein